MRRRRKMCAAEEKSCARPWARLVAGKRVSPRAAIAPLMPTSTIPAAADTKRPLVLPPPLSDGAAIAREERRRERNRGEQEERVHQVGAHRVRPRDGGIVGDELKQDQPGPDRR